jgi:DNA invertase Pin-like site-specific DNA recombinase
MKRAAVYTRISTSEQNATTQLLDLRQLASQRGLEIVAEFGDTISGVKARRPGLDALLRDARRGRFDVVMTWSCDRIARSTRHLLEVLDELRRLNVEFLSLREQLDTGGALGRAVTIIIGAIAELERSLIVERVRAGMRRQARRATYRKTGTGAGSRTTVCRVLSQQTASSQDRHL